MAGFADLAPPEASVSKLSAHHVVSLDGIRGLAVLMVIFYYLSVFVEGSGLVGKALRAPMRIEWAGVDLFFVLSGFLITGILLDTGDRTVTSDLSMQDARFAFFLSITWC